MCCWHQFLSGLSRRAGRSRGRSPWCWQFPPLSTNILLIKSKLKLESRAIVVGVAMSPRNFGGKYRCRPQPPVAKVHAPVFPGNQSVSIELHQSGVIACMTTSCGVFKSWISVAHCPFQRKWRVLHIRYISVLEQVGMSFNGIAYLMKVYLLFKREFPRVLMTWCTARARISNVRSPM